MVPKPRLASRTGDACLAASDLSLFLLNFVRLRLHVAPLAPRGNKLPSPVCIDVQWKLRQGAQHDAGVTLVHNVDDAILIAVRNQRIPFQRRAQTDFRHAQHWA